MAAVSGGRETGRAASWRRLAWVGPLAGVAAAAANVVVFYLGVALGLVSDTVSVSNGQPLTATAVVISSFIPAIAGAILFALLGRFTRRPVRIFRVVAVVVAVLSLVTPFTIPGITGGMVFVLLLMHVVAAVVITGVLTAVARD